MKNLRRISQGLFLLAFIFLFLQTESKGRDELGYPVKIFLDFDPLVFITTLFSSHTVAKAFYFSIITIIVTVILGRVFCGWICPLGTLNNVAGYFKKSKDKVRNWHKLKYYILIFLIVSSIFTLQIVGIMDPLSLLIRSLSVSMYPVFNYATNAFFNTLYSLNIKLISAVSEPILSGLKKNSFIFWAAAIQSICINWNYISDNLRPEFFRKKILVQISVSFGRSARTIIKIRTSEALSERGLHFLRCVC